ncbi:chromatin modification- protein VID21, partial [Coemansia sp. RSA 2708]
QRQQLLREYFFWASASDGDIVRALESGASIFSGVGFGDEVHEFMTRYSEDPEEALSTLRRQGQQKWAAVPKLDAHAALPLAAETTAPRFQKASDRMDVDDEDVMDTKHLVHPDDVVFQSQLDPVPVAQVVSKYSVPDARALENNLALYNYQEQIDELNGKSMNMHSWLLHAQEQPLYEVVGQSSKLLSTRDWTTVRDELIQVRVLERIEELKEKGKWSFWQPRRHRAPPRSKAHWDHLLAEMVWMHEDFAEERKLKRAVARTIASWVMDYHQATDKSRYVVNGQRRVLPDHFASANVAESRPGSPGSDLAESAPEPEPLLMTDKELGDTKANETAVEGSNGTNGEAVAVPSSTAESISERDTSEVPLEAVVKAEPNAESAIADRAADSHSEAAEDHVVPSGVDALDEPALSVYHILTQLPYAAGVEEILDDSLFAQQQLTTLAPYAPGWEEPYCDILDALPVVPISKAMWADASNDDDGAIDERELLQLDDTQRMQGTDAELHGPRSIFARNMLAPPMLAMFTQANKPQRTAHGAVGQPPADTAVQQAAGEACPGQAVFEWTMERDRILARLIQQYTGNWRLITESFNHTCALYGSRAVAARVCYERWAAIRDDYSLDRTTVQTGFDGPFGRAKERWSAQLAVQPAAPAPSAMQLATSVVAHSETLKVVNASQKRRESAAPATVAPREIKALPADQKVPTPAELSKLKAENDRRLQQLFMEQRQATAAAAALAMQQQRAMNPQLQAFQISRQIAVLQAMLASGRGYITYNFCSSSSNSSSSNTNNKVGW